MPSRPTPLSAAEQADITKTFIDEAAVRRRSTTLKDGDIFWSGIPGDCLAFLEELDRGNITNSVKYTIVGADADDQGGVMASFITDVAEQVFKQNTFLVGHVQGDQTNLVVFPSPAALDAGPGDVDVEKAMMRIGRLLAFVRGQNHLRQEDYYRKSTNGLAAIPVQLITFRLPVEIRFDLFRAVVDGTDEVADIGLGTFLQRERDRIERSGHPSKTVGEFRQKLAELYMDDILPNVDDIDAFDAYEKVLSKRLVRSWAMQRVRDGYNSQMGLRRYPYRRSWFDPETGLVYKDMFGLMKYSNSDIIRLLQYGERDDSGVFRVALDNRLGQYKALLEAVISKFTEEQCVLFVLALTGQKVLPNHKVRVNCMVPEGLGTRSIFPHSCDYRLDMTFPPTWGSTHRDRVDQLLFSFKEMFLSNTYHAFGKR
ncbi:HECT domain-containing protein [Plasmodiophora brassicae]